MAAIVVFKHFLQNHDEIRNTVWVAKTTTTPGKAIEVLTLFASSLFFSYLLQRPIEVLYEDSLFYQSSMMLSTYLEIIITMFVWTGLFMFQMSRLPTALIYTGDKLVVKSLILKEEIISLVEVQGVYLVGPFKKHGLKYLLGSRCSIMAVVFNWAFWRPSLEIKTKSGISYVLNVINAQDLVTEINEIIDNQKSEGDSIALVQVA